MLLQKVKQKEILTFKIRNNMRYALYNHMGVVRSANRMGKMFPVKIVKQVRTLRSGCCVVGSC